MTAIDVAGSYQKRVDWQVEKAAGVSLGIAKADEGLSFVDSYFNTNWNGIAAAGLERAAYHFGHPSNAPAAEVAHFLDAINKAGGLRPTDTLFLDIEANDGKRSSAAWAYTFMSILDAQVSNKKGIYTGKWFIDGNGGPPAWAPCTKWALWMSMYQATLPTQAQLAPWTNCVLWQNTSSSRQPGVNGVCDSDIIVNGGYFTSTLNGKPTQTGAQPVAKAGAMIRSTASGNGYWIFDVDGGVFTEGDAQFYGSLGSTPLAAPIVGAETTSTKDGYWMVGADGGVFAFGSARAFGNLSNFKLAAPIVGMTVMPNNDGYILLGEDNGTFPFGSAPSLGHP